MSNSLLYIVKGKCRWARSTGKAEALVLWLEKVGFDVNEFDYIWIQEYRVSGGKDSPLQELVSQYMGPAGPVIEAQAKRLKRIDLVADRAVEKLDTALSGMIVRGLH